MHYKFRIPDKNAELEKLQAELQAVQQSNEDYARELDAYKKKLDDAEREQKKALENAQSKEIF